MVALLPIFALKRVHNSKIELTVLFCLLYDDE